ncbi:MAG: sugar phosphate isomerase/epimerase, partial [Sedimentibacter sp.]
LGTVIWNNENLDNIFKDINIIHHIHISEPYLDRIVHRKLHKKLKDLLLEKEYNRYVSIEMKNFEDINIVKHTVNYINEVMR